MVEVRRWFGGDRTIEEQLLGLDSALDECHGKTVLDVGCAEGLIALEFAKKGAIVHGIEISQARIDTAKAECEGLPVTFQQGDLGVLKPGKKYDIVLALGVAHKLMRPEVGIRFAAKSSKGLVVVRMSGDTKNGMLKSKHHTRIVCDVNREMARFGFKLEKVTDGPRGEPVHYYRC